MYCGGSKMEANEDSCIMIMLNPLIGDKFNTYHITVSIELDIHVTSVNGFIKQINTQNGRFLKSKLIGKRFIFEEVKKYYSDKLDEIMSDMISPEEIRPYPAPGQIWRHTLSDRSVEIVLLAVFGLECSQDEIYNWFPSHVLCDDQVPCPAEMVPVYAWETITPWEQCVIFRDKSTLGRVLTVKTFLSEIENGRRLNFSFERKKL